jgi:hypothetical protein
MQKASMETMLID